MSAVFGAPEQAKIKQVISEGITVLQEIDDLKAGLSDTVKHVAEELDIKPALLNKAMKIAMKGEFSKAFDEFDMVETLLDISGHANRDKE